MKRTIVMVIASVAGAAILGSAPSSDAFTLLQPKRKYDVLPVPIDIDTAATETSITDGDFGVTSMLDIVNDPTIGWNSVPTGNGDTILLYTSNLAAVLGDGFPTFQSNDPMGICTNGCLAATLTGFFTQSSGPDTIDDSDCFSTTQVSFTSRAEDTPQSCSNNEFFIEGILVHEIGHMIGLGHSNAGGSTMRAFVNACDPNPESLSNDDRNGANRLY